LARLAGKPRRDFDINKDTPERILILRPDGMAEMLGCLPLIWLLRQTWPEVRITVATEPGGRPIARMCPALNEVIQLEGINSMWGRVRLAKRLQGYDIAIAAKSIYSHDLGQLIRLTNAPMRIGFEPTPLMHTPFYFTKTVDGPQETEESEARYQTLLRLARPLKIDPPYEIRFDINPGKDALFKAKNTTAELTQPIGERQSLTPYVVVNISSEGQRNWEHQQYADFLAGLAGDRRVPTAIVYRDVDKERAKRLVKDVKTFAPVVAVPSNDAEELAAVLAGARLVFTPSHAVALLAAAVDVPTLVLWWEGDFFKLSSPHPRHSFLRADEEPEAATPTYALNLMNELWNGEPANQGPPPPQPPGDSQTA